MQHQDETCHITGALLQTPPIMMTQAATTGSVLSTTLKDAKSKKRSIPKGERNVRTIEAQSIKGYRGEDNLDDLLNYIDPKPKNGIVGTNNNSNSNDHANLLEDKKKKLPTKNKGEKVNKLKKCNSMEELRSSPLSKASSITTPPNKIDHDVTLRSKSIHNNSNVTTTVTNKKNVTSGGGGGSDKVQQPQNKRNERRSWGTEGLNYLSEQANDLQREREKMENESEIIADFVKINDDDKVIQMSLPASGTAMDTENVDSSNSSNNGMDMELDSISIEPQTADFCVVQKKRKVKRKSDERGDYGERNNRMLSSYGNNNNNNSNNNNKRDQVMNNRGTRNNSYNDRGDAKQSRVAKNSSDAKVHTGGAKSRRKSASSMPPSDKSDDSDVDSVQSLPMETTKSFLNSSHGAHSNANGQEHISNNNNNNNNSNTNHNNNNNKKSNKNQQNHQQQQSKSQISYADIAKSINNNKNKLDAIGKSGINSNNNNPSTDKWPSVSSSLSSSAATNNQINSNNNTTSNINNNNNSINNNKSDSQFPFAIPQPALQSPAPITAAATLAAQPPQTIIDSNQQQQNQKKSSAISNKLSFPELVETNNTKNKLLNNVNCVNNNSDTSTTTLSDVTNNNTNNVDQNASSGSHYDVKPMMINYDSNNNNNNNNNDYIHQITPTTTTTTSSSTSKKNTISYSQTLLVDHVEQLDPNGNLEELSSIPTTNTNRMGLIKSKSVDHNNFNIDQYPSLEKTLGKSAKKMPLADVLKPVTTLRVMPLEVTTNKKVKQITHPKLLQKMEQTKDENIKRTKKDKAGSDKTLLKKSNVLVQTPQQQQLQNPVNYRPAVIILNDATDQKAIEDESDFGITFGFDINEHLLHDHPASAHESTATTIGINDNISLENNKNNNNCDIIDNKLFTSTLLINNNNSGAVSGGGPSENHHNHHLVSPNQTAAPQLQFIVPLSNNQSSSTTTIIEKNNHHQPQQQQHLMNCKENILDSSTQSSNDLGYISTSGSTPPTQKSMINDDDLQKVDRQFLNFNESAGGGEEECKVGQLMATCSQIEAQMDENCVPMMILPVFIPPEQTVQYNQEGVVSFVLEGKIY